MLCSVCGTEVTRRPGARGPLPKSHPACRPARRAAARRSQRAAAAGRLIPWDPSWPSLVVDVDPGVLRDEVLGIGERDARTGEEYVPWLTGSPLPLVSTPEEAEALLAAFEAWATSSSAARLASTPPVPLPSTREAERAVAAGDWQHEARLPAHERRPHIPSTADPARIEVAFDLLAAQARRSGVLGAA